MAAEAGGWLQQAEACDPDRRPPPAAPCGEEYGLPEVQPPGPVPLHPLHPPRHPLHPTQCTGLPLLHLAICVYACHTSVQLPASHNAKHNIQRVFKLFA